MYRVHKPVGMTSHTVVRRASAVGEAGSHRPLCHAGTLDPFAEGLLLLLSGEATHLMDLIHAVPKTYRARVVWGLETDTGDAGGVQVFAGDPSALTLSTLDRALEPFLGWRDQVPPPTSAKKIRGEPAYRLAHRGEPVNLPPSQVYLHQAQWVEHDLPRWSDLELTCRGGFYVRALARDLGRALGCGAHLSALQRLSIGPWGDVAEGQTIGLHGTELLPWYPSAVATREELRSVDELVRIASDRREPPGWTAPPGFPPPPARVRIFDHLRAPAPGIVPQRGQLVGLLDPVTRSFQRFRSPL